MFEQNHLYLYLISRERTKEWEREIMGEESLKTGESGKKSKRRSSLKLKLLSLFTNRRPRSHEESYPETLCCLH
jgi:hypothetical protein